MYPDTVMNEESIMMYCRINKTTRSMRTVVIIRTEPVPLNKLWLPDTVFTTIHS